MATTEEIETLRENLGEMIPEGGSASDTLFSDTQVANWVDRFPSILHASVHGWTMKKAQFANLVDVTDGASARKLGDLMAHADSMILTYTRELSGSRSSRSRIGKIVRE